MADAKPVKFRLQNYSQEQKEFMRYFFNDLVANGMAYPNPTSKRACASLIFLKPGAQLRFTVDLQPLKIFTVRHSFPIQILWIEISGLKEAQ